MSTDALRAMGPLRAISWRATWLTASGLLNLLLIGVIAGHLFGTRHALHRPGALVQGAQIRALPHEERQRFTTVMASHRDAIHAARLAQRRARLTVRTDIGAPTFDAGKLAADFAALRAANSDLQAAVSDGLVAALQTLSPSARATLVANKLR